MPLSSLEQTVVRAIAEREDELVDLAGDLIAFDTTARDVGDPPRREADLQSHLADRISRVGAQADLFEPDGGPQLFATLRGSGSGPALLFNGHIDVVSAEPRAEWTTDPFTPSLRDGRLYGRGACDMKGGIAAMWIAAETLAELGIGLGGDL